MEQKPDNFQLNGITQAHHDNTSDNKEHKKMNCEDPDYGKEHDWKRFSLILVTYIVFILALGFNSLQSVFYSPNSKLFPIPTGNVSDKFFTDITPAGWTFSIWGFIYTWQVVWLVYSFFCLFRRTKTGHLLYLKPDFFHYGFFIAYMINMASNIIWIFLWGYEHLGWALLFIVTLTFSLYIALFISFRKIHENEKKLKELGLTKDIWMTRIFVQNGISFYATWVSIASNLNFAIYITWRLGADMTNAGSAALFLVLSAIVVYWILENFIWRHYLIYNFSPWIVIVVALIGSISKNWVSASPTRNNIITLIMIIIVGLLIIARIILFILYHTVLKHKFLNFRVSDNSQNGSASYEQKNGSIHKV